MKLRTKPYPHQLKAVKRAVKRGNYAFFFEPRLGKSKAALDAMAVQHVRGKVNRVVIIAPLTVLDVWMDQIVEHLAVPAAVRIVGEPPTFFWPTAQDSKNKKPMLVIYLINYDKFSRRGESETYRNEYLRMVERWKPDLLVLDESHRVKSSGAVRSQALWRMVRRLRDSRTGGLPYVYLLTGTPNPKGYIDLFSQFRVLDETIFGTSRAGFEDLYCEYGLGKRRYQIIRYRNVPQLKEKIKAHSSVVTSKRAGLAGKREFQRLRVSLPDNAKVMYQEMAEDLITQIEDKTIEAKNAGVKRMRLLQITGGFTTDGDSIHGAKLAAAADFLLDMKEQGEKVVVFARFIPEVRALSGLCVRLGYSHRTVWGAVKRRERTAYIDWFRTVKGPAALVCQPETMKLGLDLSVAAEELFYSLPDSWETFFQCTERVRGPKQKRPVRYSIILARGTVDVSVLSTLRNRRDMHKEMMRSPKSFMYGL